MTHGDIINLWPSLSDFADDMGVQYGTAKAMRRRGTIPTQYFNAVVRSASLRGFDSVTLEALVNAVSKEGEAA